jgi:hypothetical protein
MSIRGTRGSFVLVNHACRQRFVNSDSTHVCGGEGEGLYRLRGAGFANVRLKGRAQKECDKRQTGKKAYVLNMPRASANPNAVRELA